jgi:heptosyltransferase-2
VSLGDVLRTTAILHLYKDDVVTWLTDTKAVPLLEGNEYIDHLIEFSISGIMQLESQEFDTVINLEKNPGLCALAERIKAWKKYGFRFDAASGGVEAYDHADWALYLARNEHHKNADGKHWLDHLYKMLGTFWDGQQPILHRKRSPNNVNALVAMNWIVGNKFKGKAWRKEGDDPLTFWHKLAQELSPDGITCDWQTTMSSIEDDAIKLRAYLEWLEPVPLIVTCDSLALHVAMAYGKRVIGS